MGINALGFNNTQQTYRQQTNTNEVNPTWNYTGTTRRQAANAARQYR